MHAWPDAAAVSGFLGKAARRRTLVAAFEGAAIGCSIGAVLTIVGIPGREQRPASIVVVTVLAILGAAARVVLGRLRDEPVSYAVERRAPDCRNVVITADELISAPAARVTTVDYVARLVCRDAARAVSALDAAELFPLWPPALGLLGAMAVWLLAVTRPELPLSVLPSSRRAAVSSASIRDVEISIVPPAYSGRPTLTARDPARIEALAGSRLRVRVRADAGSVSIETLSGKRVLAETGERGGVFTGDVLADADGFIALEPATSSGRVGPRRLVGLSVVPDRAPQVKILKPGQDIFMRDTAQTIALSIEASDDIGLASLRLRYTKVAGSGERFTFSEGELPITVTRVDARRWTARADWNLAPLGLTPGDMVVYRAVAADQRPGATPVESDSYIAELLAPGGDAAAGFALDPDQERYAVSQQMVILKTERLTATRASMTPEAVADAAQEIAVEQRKVRAEFVFMMGGEIADAPDPTSNLNELNETAEAEGESDLAAGRMANQGRVALLQAIRSMSRASTALTTADLAPALVQERAALAQLERAFSRSRILLRALTQREALDLTRRLTGTLTDAARDVHPSADPPRDPRVDALRQALASIASLAGTRPTNAAASDASALAQRVLQVDPSSKPLQDVATLLDGAASALGAGRTAGARAQLDRAATALAGALRMNLIAAPAGGPSLRGSRLAGALADLLRRGGGVR